MIELMLIAELNKPFDYRGSVRVNGEPLVTEQAKGQYRYVNSQRRSGSGRRGMRKSEAKEQVTTWLVEYSFNNGVSHESESYSTYDSCNTRAKQLESEGAYVSRWCVEV